ncbi:MAG: DEAD/DEAH box helicase [Saprospiraceae bacterium]
MTTFKSMGLSDEVLAVLDEIGFVEPSEIQQKSIPYLLSEYTDFIGLAQTGTGKTAAYGLPIADRVDPDNDATQVLILSPTRELCQQITEQLNIFKRNHKGINVLSVYGGARIKDQIQRLNKEVQHIIVATPGRLIDLIGRKIVSLDQLHLLVLDEADEMLNMGFREEIDKILQYTPEDKMVWLFSATMPAAIKEIVKRYMHKPLEVKIKAKERVNKNISHKYACIQVKHKLEALKRILDAEPNFKGIVFCRTKADTQNLAESLLKEDFKADAIHGDLSQELRERVMKRFKMDEINILVATDVAARGIDVNELSHVIHYSLPDDKEYYTHRSGRTARAGKKGISIALINPSQRYRLKKIENGLSIQFNNYQIPDSSKLIHGKVVRWAEELTGADHKSLDKNYGNQFKELLHDLSKDELIEKLLSIKMSEMRTISTLDLNEELKTGSRHSEKKDKGKSRSGRRKKRGPRGFDNKRDSKKSGRKKSKRRKR